MRKLLLTVLLFGIGHGAQAQGGKNWLQFAEGADGSLHYLDPDRIQRDGYGVRTIRSWWLADVAAPKVAKGVARQIALYRVDCNTLEITPLQEDDFDAKGKAIASYPQGGRSVYPIPNSLAELFAQSACAHAVNNGRLQ